MVRVTNILYSYIQALVLHDLQVGYKNRSERLVWCMGGAPGECGACRSLITGLIEGEQTGSWKQVTNGAHR